MESGKPGESPGMIQRNLANFPYPSPSVAMTYFLFRTNFWFLLSQFTVNARMVQTLCVCVCVCVCVGCGCGAMGRMIVIVLSCKLCACRSFLERPPRMPCSSWSAKRIWI